MARRKKGKRANGEGTIYKLPNGRWRGELTVAFDEEGKQKRRRVTAATQAEVQEKLAALRPRLHLAKEVDPRLKVKDYLRDQWLPDHKPHVKPRTFANYEEVVERYIVDHIGHLKLAKLEPSQVQRMLRLLSEEKSVDCANRTRRVLSTALNRAVEWKMIPENPVKGTKPYKQERRDLTIWTPEQTVRFLDTTQGLQHSYPFDHYHAFYLMMSTGLRCGELLGLHWDDLVGNVLRVRRSVGHIRGKLHIGLPKTKKSMRRVTLAPDVLEVLADHKRRQDEQKDYLGEAYDDQGIMFASQIGTYTHPRNLARVWFALQDKVQRIWVAESGYDKDAEKQYEEGKLLPRLRLHDLRHLHASICIRQGMDVKMLADRLGHKHASMTLDVYTHLLGQREESAVSVLSLANSARSLN